MKSKMQIRNFGNLRLVYWFVIFTLFLIPVTNSFFGNIDRLVKSIASGVEYHKSLDVLVQEKKQLSSKVRNYHTTEGLKTLIKDRLNRVEKGESIIKFNDPVAGDR